MNYFRPTFQTCKVGRIRSSRWIPSALSARFPRVRRDLCGARPPARACVRRDVSLLHPIRARIGAVPARQRAANIAALFISFLGHFSPLCYYGNSIQFYSSHFIIIFFSLCWPAFRPLVLFCVVFSSLPVCVCRAHAGPVPRATPWKDGRLRIARPPWSLSRSTPGRETTKKAKKKKIARIIFCAFPVAVSAPPPRRPGTSATIKIASATIFFFFILIVRESPSREIAPLGLSFSSYCGSASLHRALCFRGKAPRARLGGGGEFQHPAPAARAPARTPSRPTPRVPPRVPRRTD